MKKQGRYGQCHASMNVILEAVGRTSVLHFLVLFMCDLLGAFDYGQEDMTMPSPFPLCCFCCLVSVAFATSGKHSRSCRPPGVGRGGGGLWLKQ